MKTWILGAVMMIPAVASVVACGGGGGVKCAGHVIDGVCVPSTGTGGSGTGGASGPGGHTSSSGTTMMSSSSGGTTSSGTCAAPPSASACASVCPDVTQCNMCVLDTDTDGNIAATTFLLQDCACAPGSTCYSACQNDPGCTGQAGTSSDACNNCVYTLPTTDACYPAFASDCQGDPACAQFRAELQSCGSLPP